MKVISVVLILNKWHKYLHHTFMNILIYCNGACSSLYISTYECFEDKYYKMYII